MHYSKKDYEVLGRQLAHGGFVRKSTFLLSVVLALLLGTSIGRYLFPATDALSRTGETRRPLSQASGDGVVAGQKNSQTLESILQHENEVRKDPQNASAWEHLGNLYFDAGEPGKAVNAYNKALEINPANTSVLTDCGVMYKQLGQFDKALEYFQKVLALNPRHEQALFNSGIVLYHDLNRKAEALEVWRALVRINPDAKAPSGEPVSKMIETHQ